ncbi:MAG: hypothetical protein JRH11_07170 [Deltaproteobacteria bacterium]|nr:hypothetical protein [Deltaproteobacteria bacterium]
MRRLLPVAIGLLLLPFLAGSVALVAWNIAVGSLAQAVGVGPEVGPDAPLAARTLAQHIFVLVQTTLAGLIGATIATRVAKSRPGTHILVFSAVWIVLDILGMTLGPGQVLPQWYKVLGLSLVPPQLFAGYKLGMVWRSRARPSADAEG